MARLLPVILALCGGCVDPKALPPPDSEATVVARVVDGVNKLRLDKGLPVLVRVAALDRVAEAYAREMAGSGNFAHAGVQGEHLEDRLERAGITNWTRAGENLSLSRISADSTKYRLPVDPAAEAIRGWQLSVTHRENLFQRDFDRCGVAAVRDPQRGEVYIVQVYLGGGE